MITDITFLQSVYVLKDLPDTGLPEVCVSGRSNIGKSSLINRIARRRNIARISQYPGKTQSLNYYEAGGVYYLVDLPGYGYAKVSKAKRKEFAELMKPYLNTRKEIMGIIQLLDSRHGPVGGDYDMLKWLNDWNGEILYVLTKADKLSRSAGMKVKRNFEKEIGKNAVLFSARTGLGLDSIISWIDRTLGLK